MYNTHFRLDLDFLFCS